MVFLSHKINLKKYKFFEKILYKNFKLNFNLDILNELTLVGFEYSTLNYTSLNLENFKNNPFKYKKYNNEYNLNNNYNKNIFCIKNYNTSNLYNTLIVNKYNKYFKHYKTLNFYFNILLLLPDIKIKASWDQIHQVIGIRGKVLNIYGNIHPINILSNFGKGLNIYDFFISCYGSRKCIIDSVLNTADSGYLSRKLIEVSQNIIIKEFYCKSNSNIKLNFNMTSTGDKIIPFYLINNKSIMGNIINLDKKNIIKYKNDRIHKKDYIILQNQNWNSLLIKDIFFCISGNFICNHCIGNSINYFKFNLPIGNLASQALGESSTQLTLRTFHTGGVFNASKKTNLYKFNKINAYLNFKNFKIRKFIYNKFNKKKTSLLYYSVKNIAYVKNISMYPNSYIKTICIKNYTYKIYLKKFSFIKFLIRNIINKYSVISIFIINYFKLNNFNFKYNLKLHLTESYSLIYINNGLCMLYKNKFWKWKLLKNFIIYINKLNYYNFLNYNELLFYNYNIKYISSKYLSNKQFFVKNKLNKFNYKCIVKHIHLNTNRFNLKLAGQESITVLK